MWDNPTLFHWPSSDLIIESSPSSDNRANYTSIQVNFLSANPTKLSRTLKRFVGKSR